MCAVTDDGADNVNWDCEYETVDQPRLLRTQSLLATISGAELILTPRDIA